MRTSGTPQGKFAPTAATITSLFRNLDLDNDGTISREDLMDVLKLLDPNLWDDSNLSMLLDEIYPDCRQSINYNEFVTWMMAGSSCAEALLERSTSSAQNHGRGAEPVAFVSRARPSGIPRGSSPARNATKERKRSPRAVDIGARGRRPSDRSVDRSRPLATEGPTNQNSTSRVSSPGIRTQSPATTPPPAARVGSRLARQACLSCRETLPDSGSNAWTTLGRNLTYVNFSELMEQLGEASEWQLLEAVPTLALEQEFDVIVGRPLKDMLPPSQTSREEGWVTCTRVEKPIVRKASSGEAAVAAVASESLAANAQGEGSLDGSNREAHETAETVTPWSDEATQVESYPEEKIQVKVVVQMQEMNEKGLLRLFSQTNLAPDDCQVWWRVGPRTGEGFQPDELLDVVIQSLDIDEDIMDAPDILTREAPPFLKPHQIKSIQWMSAREHSADPFIADWHAVRPLQWEFSAPLSKALARRTNEEVDLTKPSQKQTPKKEGSSRVGLGDGPLALQLDYRMENVYRIHGGVLADPVGSGKTATCLSHVACSHGTPMPDSGGWQRQYLVPLDATLVLCPENVHHQWIQEIEKWPELQDMISHVAIHNVEALAKEGLRSSTKRKARVVVAPYSVFNDPLYKTQLASPLSSPEDWKKKVGSLQLQVKKGEACKGLALECYRWRRVILDEFHELAGTSDSLKLARRALRCLQSSTRWGVTGTPEELLRSTGAARRAAQIFHCELNARRSAQRFCEQHYRSSRVELDVSVQHRLIPVYHTAQEKAIYFQYVRDLGLSLGSRPWCEANMAKLRLLLQLCSHFTAEEAPVAMRSATSSAEAAVALHTHKGRAVTAALLEAESQTSLWETRCMELEDLKHEAISHGPRKRPQINPKCATCVALKSSCVDCRKSLLSQACVSLQSAHKRAMDALKSLCFFDTVWQLATRSSENVACVICFDDYYIQDGGLLHCAHMFCMNCITQAIKVGRKACPLCRAPMDASKLVPVRELRAELQKNEAEEEQEKQLDYGTSFRKYGSKLQAIVMALDTVIKEDPEAKVILFSQWQNLETKIANALLEFHISHLRLSTCADIFERRRVLEAFQDPTDRQFRLLLLSLDGHASGTNLTCASHVFIVHPMLAATAEQQASYERQAIGRAARLGQQKTVTVWRFLTKSTVEDQVALATGS